jgi:membrane associated rhomboid family serine protease
MNTVFSITRGVRALLIANLAVFIVQWLPGIGPLLFKFGSIVSYDIFAQGQVWRLVTYMFLHSVTTVFHFLFNMLALWMFGPELEERWGTRRFLSFYALCGVGAGLFSMFYLFSPVTRFLPVIGASGAVLGLLTAYACYFPDRQVLLFFVLPIRVWMLVAGYAVLSLVFALSQRGGVVAHLIHFGGIAVAFAYVKSYARIEARFDEFRSRRRERGMRARAEETLARKRFFEEKIDPVLEKISREGMASLTREEKKLLRQAGQEGRERLKREKIIPFDAFRKPER